MALTREQMIETIHDGGSFIYKGKLVTKEENIPGKAEFAMTGNEREAEREKLQKQLDALDLNAGKGDKDKKPAGEADDYPEGFPARSKAVLKKLGKTFAEVKAMTREQLIELDGIAEASADEIIAFTSNN